MNESESFCGGSDEPDPVSGLAIDFDDDARSAAEAAGVDPRRLADAVDSVARALRLVDPAVAFIVIGDERMAAMHAQFSGVEGTTDVLTFDLRDDPIDARDAVAAGRPIPGVEGEVYLCVDEAARRAAERGHDASRELLLYATHGLLHLVGYDDHDEDDYLAMHAREDALLESIGVGRTFAVPLATKSDRKAPNSRAATRPRSSASREAVKRTKPRAHRSTGKGVRR